MLLLEHEGKALLREHGIATPRGVVAGDAAGLGGALAGLAGPYMVKAQILAGGRGKAGGVVAAATPAEAAAAAARLLAGRIKDQPVASVLVEECAALRRERYLAILLDGEEMICLIGREGGVEVENFFSGGQSAFETIRIDPRYGLGPYQIRRALESLGIEPLAWPAFTNVATRLAQLFRAADATLAEINPLAELADGSLLALDARIAIDDGALFRQPRLAAIASARVPADGLEARMKALEIQYVPVGGTIGLVSSGAGVGTTIMDWVALEGGRVAAFVDLDYSIMSGKTDPAMALIFDHWLQDPEITSIIVNFTTCGLRLDVIARSLIAVLAERGGPRLVKPVHLHLQGNRAPIAHQILREAGYPVCETLGQAVHEAMSAGPLARGGRA